MIHLQVTTGTEGIVTLDCPEHKIKVEFCYKADDDQYYIEVHQPYRPVQTQSVVRSDYERDEVFYNRAYAKAHSIASQLMEECACIDSNEQRLQSYLEELKRDHITRMEMVIEHFDFDPLDERQLDRVVRVVHKMKQLCDELSEAS